MFVLSLWGQMFCLLHRNENVGQFGWPYWKVLECNWIHRLKNCQQKSTFSHLLALHSTVLASFIQDYQIISITKPILGRRGTWILDIRPFAIIGLIWILWPSWTNPVTEQLQYFHWLSINCVFHTWRWIQFYYIKIEK